MGVSQPSGQPEKSGSGHESPCPCQGFRAADKDVPIGIANDALWRRFCAAAGRPELADDPRFRTNVDRVRHRAEAAALVQGVIGTWTCGDWVALLTALKVPCAPINSLADVLAHPHTLARGMVLEYDHPFLGGLRTVAQPILFDGSPRAVRLPPPMHGEHSRAVLAELG